ncbi:hypothetical protein [Nocardia goodfellowii]|uniref:Secreted protein n=1 Tax=Nocardia goodfellowii TaxID=882446 RepID=A0ABS4QR40_9NOCA|nr:hypothetical protein [Nocardia goodfellowii]MBP2194174.1 hypothetical protein [Nocardia goodfellowii]
MAALGAVIAALVGAVLGARLTQRREADNWSRDQRLAAYTALLEAVEECSEAFTLLASSLDLWRYDWDRIKSNKPKVSKLLGDWDAGGAKVDKAVTAAELVASSELLPTVIVTRFAYHRQSILLMQFDYMQQIDADAWKSVQSQTFDTLNKLRAAFRHDIQRTLNPETAWASMARSSGRRGKALLQRLRHSVSRATSGELAPSHQQ